MTAPPTRFGEERLAPLRVPPLQRSSLRDQALSHLRERLVSGELEPGSIYSASALAIELGVSSSPVREAMLTMVNQGLMEVVRNRGFRVVPISVRDRQEITEMRALIEVPSMGRLAGRPELLAVEDEYRRVAHEIVTAAQVGDIVSYLEADRTFHLGLLGLLGNRRLSQSVEALRDQTRLFGLRALSEAGRLVQSAEEHEVVLDAMVAGDRDRTERLMLEHLSHIGGDWGSAD